MVCMTTGGLPASRCHFTKIQRNATTTSRAEDRAKVAEEKASTAITAIGMVKTPEQKKTKLSNRDAKKFWPDTYTEDRVDNQILS